MQNASASARLISKTTYLALRASIPLGLGDVRPQTSSWAFRSTALLFSIIGALLSQC